MSMLNSCHLLFDHFLFALIHGPNIPGSFAVVVLATLDFTFTTRHIHNWELFMLCPSHFILSVTISYCSPLFLSSIWDTFWPRGLIFWCRIFLSFRTVHGVVMARVMEGFATPSSSGPPEPSSMTHPPWVAPHSMILSFLSFASPFATTRL